MRLAIVTDFFDGSLGGCERYLRRLIPIIRGQGHQVEIYCHGGADPLEGTILHPICPVPYPRFIREWIFCREVARRLGTPRPDVVLTTRPFAEATHYRLSAGLHKLAFEAEREALESPLRRQLYSIGLALNPKRRHLIRLQDRVLSGPSHPRLMVNSKMVKNHLTQSYIISAEQVTVLYSGVDLSRFRPGPTSRPKGQCDPLQLLFVGHNFLLKGLHCLMAALNQPECSSLNIQLTVAGNGPVRAFRRLSRGLGISSKVRFLGGVSEQRLIPLYQESDALVHPTFYDPCALVVLEALACGCPVVTTRNNGAAELIEPAQNGLVIENPRNHRALSAAIRTLADPERRRHMSRAAVARAQDFDLVTHAAKVISWLGLR